MPNCDFYALAPDVIEVLDFIFTQPGWQLVELASQHDQPLRTFLSTHDVVDAFPSFASLSMSLHFQLYAKTVGGQVGHRRIDFDPRLVEGASFRYDSTGWGLIQLYFGHVRDGRLTNCHTNHNSATRAQAWAPTYRNDPSMDSPEQWDWKEVTRISSRLNRFVRSRAPGKLHSRPIMRNAWEARERAEVQLQFP